MLAGLIPAPELRSPLRDASRFVSATYSCWNEFLFSFVLCSTTSGSSRIVKLV